jgi:DNA-binding response OmpR family regulator
MRILVVEDDRKVATFVGTALQQEGHAVDLLHEGWGAAEHLSALPRSRTQIFSVRSSSCEDARP